MVENLKINLHYRIVTMVIVTMVIVTMGIAYIKKWNS